MLVPSLVSIGPSSFLQSAACLGPAVLALDSGSLEFSSSIRQMTCLEPFTSAAGVAWMGLLPFVLDPVHTELLLLAQGCTCLGLSMPVLDLAKAEPSLLLKSFIHVGSTSSICGKAVLGSPLSVLEMVTPGSFVPPKGAA